MVVRCIYSTTELIRTSLCCKEKPYAEDSLYYYYWWQRQACRPALQEMESSSQAPQALVRNQTHHQSDLMSLGNYYSPCVSHPCQYAFWPWAMGQVWVQHEGLWQQMQNNAAAEIPPWLSISTCSLLHYSWGHYHVCSRGRAKQARARQNGTTSSAHQFNVSAKAELQVCCILSSGSSLMSKAVSTRGRMKWCPGGQGQAPLFRVALWGSDLACYYVRFNKSCITKLF